MVAQKETWKESIIAGSLKPESLRGHLRSCGYRPNLLRSGITLGEFAIPLVGFAQLPADSRSACVAVISADTDPRTAVERCRPLGTPLVFVCFDNNLQWWKQGASSAEWLDSVEADDVQGLFEKRKDDFSPEAIYRAKTWGRFRSEYQLTFVDVGLMPLLEEEVGTTLGQLIERNVTDIKRRLGWNDISNVQGQWIIQTIFWLVSGKILRDKGVDSFEGLSLTDVDEVFNRVAGHYGSGQIEIGSKQERAALVESARTIEQFASLELTTTESLAHVYENTLISKATRSSLGTHSTPSYLVDYIVGNLAEWIREIPENERNVFEPACGHAGFLVSAMRLLSELLPPEKAIASRRGPYLRSRLHGTDIDAFALELARLSLTLTDIPNPDGWDLQAKDMFLRDDLSVQAAKSTIILANPPFDNFTAEQRKSYKEDGSEITHINKAAEMVSRTVRSLPVGGVFGFVLPQGIMHSDNAAAMRELLVSECELLEICLFPDKVFSFSDAESAIVLGRRTQPTRKPLSYRRVRERDIDSFRTQYGASTARAFRQSRFTEGTGFSLRVPDLEEVWAVFNDFPKLAEVAELGQGLVFHGRDLPIGFRTYSDGWFEGAEKGFVSFDRGLLIHELPTEYWLNLDDSVIRRPQSGTETGIPQVLLNYAPAGRGTWRLKALVDEEGHAVTSRFIPVRPTKKKYSLETLWAILNSPVANAFAFCHLSKRDNIVGDIRRIPLPKSTSFAALNRAATAYLESASEGVDSSELESLLLQVDCTVLKLYSLPVALERALLDLFAGYKRVGVSFKQDRYFPEGFDHPVSLSEFVGFKRDWSKTNRERGLLIEKSIDGGKLAKDDQARLDALQAYANYYIEETTPRPTDALEELEDGVLEGMKRKDIAD